MDTMNQGTIAVGSIAELANLLANMTPEQLQNVQLDPILYNALAQSIEPNLQIPASEITNNAPQQTITKTQAESITKSSVNVSVVTTFSNSSNGNKTNSNLSVTTSHNSSITPHSIVSTATSTNSVTVQSQNITPAAVVNTINKTQQQHVQKINPTVPNSVKTSKENLNSQSGKQKTVSQSNHTNGTEKIPVITQSVNRTDKIVEKPGRILKLVDREGNVISKTEYKSSGEIVFPHGYSIKQPGSKDGKKEPIQNSIQNTTLTQTKPISNSSVKIPPDTTKKVLEATKAAEQFVQNHDSKILKKSEQSLECNEKLVSPPGPKPGTFTKSFKILNKSHPPPAAKKRLPREVDEVEEIRNAIAASKVSGEGALRQKMKTELENQMKRFKGTAPAVIKEKESLLSKTPSKEIKLPVKEIRIPTQTVKQPHKDLKSPFKPVKEEVKPQKETNITVINKMVKDKSIKPTKTNSDDSNDFVTKKPSKAQRILKKKRRDKLIVEEPRKREWPKKFNDFVCSADGKKDKQTKDEPKKKRYFFPINEKSVEKTSSSPRKSDTTQINNPETKKSKDNSETAKVKDNIAITTKLIDNSERTKLKDNNAEKTKLKDNNIETKKLNDNVEISIDNKSPDVGKGLPSEVNDNKTTSNELEVKNKDKILKESINIELPEDIKIDENLKTKQVDEISTDETNETVKTEAVDSSSEKTLLPNELAKIDSTAKTESTPTKPAKTKNQLRNNKKRKRSKQSRVTFEPEVLPQHLKKAKVKPVESALIDVNKIRLKSLYQETMFALDDLASPETCSKLSRKDWVCTMCGKPPVVGDLDVLFGPYTVKVADTVDPMTVWLHRDCAIWTSSICLTNQSLNGVGEALEYAAKTKCSLCSQVGATLECHSKQCRDNYHYICARQRGCTFTLESFSILCPKHK